jgi:hypothetical protein
VEPIPLVPKAARVTLKPKRVLVAWDACLEASRAVRESLYILVDADKVRVVMVDSVEDKRHHGAEPAADVAIYLSRHGVKVTVDRLPSSNLSIADAVTTLLLLENEAADLYLMPPCGADASPSLRAALTASRWGRNRTERCGNIDDFDS